MNWMRYGSIAVIAAVLLTGGLYLWFTSTTTADPGDQDDVIARIEDSPELLTDLEIRNTTMVGDRVLVQLDYAGDDTTKPQESAEWHYLAETTAERLYHDAVRNRGIEVQIYENDRLRGVAVAGL